MASFRNQPQKGKHIILFDGVCGLCDRLVQFVLREDKKNKFMFASLQSEFAKEVLASYGKSVELPLTTFYAIANYGTKKERIMQQSDAGIFVMVELGGINKLAALLMTVPAKYRDSVYNFIARHRYKVFGSSDTCMVPSESHAKRFIEI